MPLLAIAVAVFGAGSLVVADEFTTSELRAIGEGRGLYLRSCTGCHGDALQGSKVGSVGPDLTLIAVRDGRFGRGHVLNHLRFGTQPFIPSMGETGDMPAWHRLYPSGTSEGRLACDALKLVRYIEFVQASPVVNEPPR